MKRWAIVVMIAALVFAFSSVAGAKSLKVEISYEKYSPAIDKSLTVLKGKRILLNTFVNEAKNTKKYNYFGSGKSIKYAANDHLENYLWYAFQKSLQYQGLRVHEPINVWGIGWGNTSSIQDPPPAGTPNFDLTITSWSAEEFSCKVKLVAPGEGLYEKEYKVTFTPSASKDKKALEKKAYTDLDKIIKTIMGDKGIQNLLTFTDRVLKLEVVE